jgi:hypothetical protein
MGTAFFTVDSLASEARASLQYSRSSSEFDNAAPTAIETPAVATPGCNWPSPEAPPRPGEPSLPGTHRGGRMGRDRLAEPVQFPHLDDGWR